MSITEYADGQTIVLHPARTITVVTVLMRYVWAQPGKLHRHSLIVGTDGVSIEQIVRSWANHAPEEHSIRGELLDFRVDQYAPIPF